MYPTNFDQHHSILSFPLFFKHVEIFQVSFPWLFTFDTLVLLSECMFIECTCFLVQNIVNGKRKIPPVLQKYSESGLLIVVFKSSKSSEFLMIFFVCLFYPVLRGNVKIFLCDCCLFFIAVQLIFKFINRIAKLLVDQIQNYYIFMLNHKEISLYHCELASFLLRYY